MGGMPLDEDVGCANCGYNLRGLTTAHDCPECGEPAMRTLRWAGRDLSRRAVAFRIARASGYPIDAILFVNDALAHTLARFDEGRHTTARDVCDGFLAFVHTYFNDAAEAADLLAEWKLHRSEDVGRIVRAMAEAGVLKTSPDDRPSDFEGLFTPDDVQKAFERPHPSLGGAPPPA
jgi:uncharacterized repeat protein (TIGR04138 family)